MFAEANIYSVANPTTMRAHLSTTDLIVLVIASIHRKVVFSITYIFSVTETTTKSAICGLLAASSIN